MMLSEILGKWGRGETPSSEECHYLRVKTLRDEAFGVNVGNVAAVVEKRSHLFRAVYPQIWAYFQGISPANFEFLWHLWLPLAEELAAQRQVMSYPLIQGILGLQGTGKTTLAAILKLILSHLGYQTLNLSLDDLYKTYGDRQQLKAQDPRFIWRGPPGTHDVGIGVEVLQQLRQSLPVLVPRFDKSAWGGAGDRAQPELVTGTDIVLFEGWFVGVRPIDPTLFDHAPDPIVTPEDRQWARESNQRLIEYLSLWAYLDKLLILYPGDYRVSQQWRLQAERQAIAAGKTGMADDEVEEFVKYFWRSLHPELFVKPLTKNPSWVDLTVEIKGDRAELRSLGKVYRPRSV